MPYERERVAADTDLRDARVLPQLHVIAWKDATENQKLESIDGFRITIASSG